MPYPHALLLKPSDAVALVVPSLPKGDFPILCEFKNDMRKLGSVQYSALVLEVLLRLSPIKLVKSADSAILVDSVDKLLEAML